MDTGFLTDGPGDANAFAEVPVGNRKTAAAICGHTPVTLSLQKFMTAP